MSPGSAPADLRDSSGLPAVSSPRVSLLLVVRSYPPVLGGSEIEAQRVCSALVRRGHRVCVVCAAEPPMPELAHWTDPLGVPVRLFGRFWPLRLRGYVYALGVACTLLRRRRDYQIVYFLMQGLQLAVGLPLARFLGKPVMMKLSGSRAIPAMRTFWLGRRELRMLRTLAQQVLVLNPDMSQDAVEAGIDSRQLRWMPNPVDTAEFSPCSPEQRARLRAELGIPPVAKVVVFTGRFSPEKNLPSLLGAFAQAVRSEPEALLVLVGDGPERPALESQAAELGLTDCIRFTGQQTSEEVRRWLQSSDIFVLVSSHEGFSCSLAEAMSSGLPCVVSDIPGNAQLIDPDVHGLYAKPGHVASAAGALAKLLRDRPLRARLGGAARQRILDHYSTDKVLDRYEALFMELLGQPPSESRSSHAAGC